MTAVRVVAVVAVLLGSAAGQQEARLFQATNLVRFDQQLVRDDKMGDPVPAIDRLSGLVRRLGGADPKAGPPVFQRARSAARGEILVARGTAEQLDAAAKVFEQLQRPVVVQARLHCSLLTMPVAVARTHGLKPGEVVATDEASTSRIARDAVKNNGTLRNLPEVVAGALAPFVRAAGEKTKDGQPAPLQLRGEMLPMQDGEVALGVHVVRGALPHDPTRLPESPLMQPMFRLAAGQSALFMVVDRDVATVLVVRCVDVTSEPLREIVGETVR